MFFKEIPDPNQLPDLPPLEEIDKNQSNLVTLEERLPINSIEDPESSYFSLLRYFFCQNSPSNSLTIPGKYVFQPIKIILYRLTCPFLKKRH